MAENEVSDESVVEMDDTLARLAKVEATVADLAIRLVELEGRMKASDNSR